MDEPALKTTRVRVLSTKLTSANNEIVELKSERAFMKSCVSDVNAILFNLIEAHDPMLPLTNRRYLAEKLRLAVAMLNILEGVSVPPDVLKQGGEIAKPTTDSFGNEEEIPKANEPLCSCL